MNKKRKAVLFLVACLGSTSASAAFKELTSSFISVASEAAQSAYQAHSSNGNSNSKAPKNFEESKNWLKVITREHHPYGFYTGCEFKFSGRNQMTLTPIHNSCGYNIRNNRKTAYESHAEHILPISWVGNAGSAFPCWKEGGRSHCQRVSPEFNLAEADLVNLQYIIGEVNMDRSHFRFAELTNGHDYGLNGKIYFDETGRRFMPPKENWGWIGRIHLYMGDNYPVRYSSSYKRMMDAWAKLPTTEWECKYNELLIRDFGKGNPHTTKACR
ncbi:putative Extracellular deoxyribonuclease [Vibrio chagasii]|nr:putative Extracellular deoxyribonuclease [Vibrio chagasii]